MSDPPQYSVEYSTQDVNDLWMIYREKLREGEDGFWTRLWRGFGSSWYLKGMLKKFNSHEAILRRVRRGSIPLDKKDIEYTDRGALWHMGPEYWHTPKPLWPRHQTQTTEGIPVEFRYDWMQVDRNYYCFIHSPFNIGWPRDLLPSKEGFVEVMRFQAVEDVKNFIRLNPQ